MNKKQVILAVAVVAMLMMCAGAQDIAYELREQNCQGQTGWWWSGQQCMWCYNDTCQTCSEWMKCDKSCINGQFSSLDDNGNSRCRSCTGEGVSQCKQLPLKKDNKYWIIEKDTYAIDCQVGFKRFGHYCFRIDSCIEYTKYGKCMNCDLEYYLDKSGKCTKCNPGAWDDAWHTGIQQSVSIDLQKYSDNAAATTGAYCKRCYGPRECYECGIWMQTGANIEKSSGSFLTTNHLRETFDRNIARQPSQCRPCNPGCVCDQPNNLCGLSTKNQQCIDDTWYYNPDEHRCYKCDQQCQSSDLAEGDIKKKINCCQKCEWDPTIRKPRCTLCKKTHSDGGGGYNGDVTSFTDRMNKVAQKSYMVCYRCDREHKLSGQDEFDFRPSTTNAGRELTFGNLGDSVIKEKLQTFVPGHTKCTKCRAVEETSFYFKDTDNKYKSMPIATDQDSFYLYYITCTQCQNGYALTSYSESNTDTDAFHRYKADITQNTKKPSYYKVNKQECRACSKLIKEQDALQPTTIPEDWKNRYKLVRRCKTTGTNVFAISQCGSNEYDPITSFDYIQDGGTFRDVAMRGPPLTDTTFYTTSSGSGTTTADFTSTFRKIENQYFSNEGIFRYYLVNSGKTGLEQTCVYNKNKCYIVKELGGVFPPTGSMPLCEKCFEHYNYVLTESKLCVKCDTSTSGIDVGCIKCAAKATDSAVPATADQIRCADCLNNLQGSWGDKKDATEGDSNVWPTTYYFNNTAFSCRSCQIGCSKCDWNKTSEATTCAKCMNYWGQITPQNTNCHKCTDKYCINCDFNQTFCKICEPGYRRITMQRGTPLEGVYCEACEQGCLQCNDNRKVCEKCSTNYYRQNGICRVRRSNCINWDIEGGFCHYCEYSYNQRNGWCYKCFNEQSGFIDCPSDIMDTNQYTSGGSNVRRGAAEPSKRILALLDQEDESF